MSSWSGRSLAFVRQVSGQPARWPSCHAAMEELQLNYNDPPRAGVWIWYRTEPYGNVALYLDDQQVLGLHPNGGLPYVTHMFDPRLGEYAGWSDPNAT